MEQLARDATGWGAHAVEFFRILGDTQYMNHLRLWNHYAPDLRCWKPGLYIDTGFRPHCPQSRCATHRLSPGPLQHPEHRYLPVVAERLQHHQGPGGRQHGQLRSACASVRWAWIFRCFTARCRRVSRSVDTAEPFNVADRLKRRVLCADLQKGVGAVYYGEGKSLALYLDNQLLNPYEIRGRRSVRSRWLMEQPARCRASLPCGGRSGTWPHRAAARSAGQSLPEREGLLSLRLQRRHGRRRVCAGRQLHRSKMRASSFLSLILPVCRATPRCRTR